MTQTNKKTILAALALICVLSLPGCGSYQAIGVFQDYKEVLYGTANANLLAGVVDFTLIGKVTGIECQGSCRATYFPPLGLCMGQRGYLFALCDDERSITGEFFAQSCTKGYGRGKDSYGNIFAFTFGMSEQEAEAELKAQLAASSAKPASPTSNPK
jgi:hypothetical protein